MEYIPSNAAISSYADEAYFSDCFSSHIEYDDQSALDLFLIVIRDTPSWVSYLMSLRNKVVVKLGLKDLGKIEDIDPNKVGSDYIVGDRIGIFTLYSNSQYEVILEDQDKHLGVKISLFLEPSTNRAQVHLSTVVHVKNTLGRVYMFFVAPVHKLIVPSTLKKLPQA